MALLRDSHGIHGTHGSLDFSLQKHDSFRGFSGLISVAHALPFATSIRPPSLRSALRVRGHFNNFPLREVI